MRRDINARQNALHTLRKVKGVPQSQATTLPRHKEEEETDTTKQAQVEQTYEEHFD